MKEYTTEFIRNIALVSHGSAGKTMLAEAFLHTSGGTTRLGKIEDGTTISDYDEEEIRRKISIYTTVLPVEYRDHKINVLDAPGFTDFVGEVVSALSVADCNNAYYRLTLHGETPLAVLKTPETEDIGFHSQIVPVHTEGLRFRQRLTVLPAVRGDPIAGHNRSCAVFPLFTVDEDPIPGIQNREDLNDVRLPGHYSSVHGNIDVAHARSFDRARFRFGGVFVFAAQVNDGLNPQVGQALPRIAGGLAAAIEPFVDLVKVGDAGNRNIAGPRQHR